MANVAAQLVVAYLESQGIDPEIADEEEGALRFGAKFDGGRMDIVLIVKENSASIEGYNFIRIPENKQDSMYKILNDLNLEYLHFKFYLDESIGQVCIRDEDIIQLDTCGEECVQLLFKMIKVVEMVYPKLMKALWA